MDNREVRVPVSLLLAPDLTASTKVVWMAMRLHPAARPVDLEVLTGLSRRTVLAGLGQITPRNRTPGGPKVKVPGALLAERAVGPQSKVVYGLLQATPDFRGQGGHFTYASMASLTKLGRSTLRRATAELVGAGWVRISQENRVSPVQFVLGSPELKRSQAEVAEAGRRLKRGKFGGEAIMQEYLSLLIDSDQFTDNARPGFLVNPLTKERLELDRFYLANVAFEFNGSQHYETSDKYSQAEVDAQHLRDLIKAGICLYLGIRLVIINTEDLSLRGMTKKIGQCMPLRTIAGHGPLIDLLESATITYRATAAAGARQKE